ncbi:pyridoxamine 5'-phosphate oxidase family protein [Pseudonocardia xishanensis]|uniref:Pyridoxamine 5'-phosphate oxidase family protein n=1 Tax=Pseudonocardia xishanensis TaxID=630995 RepID=A0ABP8RMC2_9PSEU
MLESLATGTEPELVELDRAGCLRLLATAEIGRVVFSHHAMPAAHPVAYVLDGEEIVFRTGGGSTLAAAARNAVVGFQTDRIDPGTRTGWSVLAVGESYEVTEPRRLAALRERLPEPWAPGRTGHTLSIPAQHLTGRRIG